ncbi:hypothetical protein [Lysobacter gummosus]|uniref:hypothetical protein n=1 Tax=Lysobacter gummosus TaxID=262324 RepID=UPI00363270C8
MGTCSSMGFLDAAARDGPGRRARTMEVRLEREVGAACQLPVAPGTAQNAKLALSTTWRPSPGVAQPLLRIRVK